jgi:large subunit ribosomal protein L16
MLSPKRTKFRKMMKGTNKGIAARGSDVSFGDFGMQAVSRPARSKPLVWRSPAT